jgi:hypothetical protein
MNDAMHPTGTVIFEVYDKDGILKQRSTNHNIITAQGDSYIADLLSLNPARVKLSAANGFIAVGTGWTGLNTKANTWVNTQVGIPTPLLAGYPQIQAPWGSVGANSLVSIGVYPIGSLNANGINEAALVTAPIQGVITTCLAYSQVIPVANVTSSDSFMITWIINFLGL